MRTLGALLLILGLAGFGGILLVRHQAPIWAATVVELVEEAETAGTDIERWIEISERAKSDLPAIPPLSQVRGAIAEVPPILEALQNFPKKLIQGTEIPTTLPTTDVLAIFDTLHEIEYRMNRIDRNISQIPFWMVPEDKRPQLTAAREKVTTARDTVRDLRRFETILNQWCEREERLLLVLQNPNEPRSTGGFAGSLIVVDFGPEVIRWKFQDMYAIDRLVPDRAEIPAPDWFHGLSQTISLRDANFWPDFPTSAGEIRKFFAEAGEKSPDTIVAITPEWVREWLGVIGPVRLENWNIEFNQYNFDLALQFLVESKIAGRWNVKQPILQLADRLFRPSAIARATPERLAQFPWQDLIRDGHLLAHARDKKLQKQIERWKIDGKLAQKNDADDFLYFDFISVGANKSEKFMWTKLNHDARIAPDGTVHHTLNVRRTHALKNDELTDLLREHSWSENVRDLLTPDLLWKLGQGENRTMLRVWVPSDAVLLRQKNPAGLIREMRRTERDFVLLEIPMNVTPGETLSARVEYLTKIERGSHDWRPYHLQVEGTPARDQTLLQATVSTTDGGMFRAETKNIGMPIPLTDTTFRAVSEW